MNNVRKEIIITIHIRLQNDYFSIEIKSHNNINSIKKIKLLQFISEFKTTTTAQTAVNVMMTTPAVTSTTLERESYRNSYYNIK